MSAVVRLAARRPLIERVPGLSVAYDVGDRDTVWPDVDGNPFAICRRRGRADEVAFPGLGLVSCDDGGELSAKLCDGRTERQLLDSFFRFGLPMLLHARGAEFLHASAVLGPSGVVGFCAPSGTGKSTTAYGLARRGYAAWADDALVFEHRGDSFESVGLPFAFRAWPDVIGHFAGESRHPPVRAPDAPVEVRRLAALCILVRGAASAPSVTRLSPAVAFEKVLAHSFSFDVTRAERNAEMVDVYMSLAEALPVYEASLGSSLDTLDRDLDAVESALLVESV